MARSPHARRTVSGAGSGALGASPAATVAAAAG